MFFYKEQAVSTVIQGTANFESAETNFDVLGTFTTESHSSSALRLTTNPLSNGGLYTGRIAGWPPIGKYYFKTTAFGGAFSAIPNTKKISARACLRSSNSYITQIVVNDVEGMNSDIQGYRFGLVEGKFVLSGKWQTLIQSTNQYDPWPGIGDVWFSLRMDVTPLGAAGDKITCYIESSPGSGVWSSTIGGTVFDITVPTNDVRYVGWGAGRSGIYVYNQAFFDNIDFQVDNA